MFLKKKWQIIAAIALGLTPKAFASSDNLSPTQNNGSKESASLMAPTSQVSPATPPRMPRPEIVPTAPRSNRHRNVLANLNHASISNLFGNEAIPEGNVNIEGLNFAGSLNVNADSDEEIAEGPAALSILPDQAAFEVREEPRLLDSPMGHHVRGGRHESTEESDSEESNTPIAAGADSTSSGSSSSSDGSSGSSDSSDSDAESEILRRFGKESFESPKPQNKRRLLSWAPKNGQSHFWINAAQAPQE